MTAGGIAGLISLLGLTILAYRRFTIINVKKTTQISDVVVLILLYLQLLVGLISIKISYNHVPDPSSMIAFANWAQGIFTLSSNIDVFILNEHWIFKTHIFLGLTLLLVFPFTRLIHIFSIPYLYLVRNGYQIVRTLK